MKKYNGYAVVDVETTGLVPEANDRIIEIAVIKLDETGSIVDEYISLVNPQRDLGLTTIHGIWTSEIMDAPVFNEIAGDIVERIKDAAFVGHNAGFDRRFLNAEFERMGARIPTMPCFCTLKLSRFVDKGVQSRRLGGLCEYYGITLQTAHSAYDDALATVELFRIYAERIGGWEKLDLHMHGSGNVISDMTGWPHLEANGVCYTRQIAAHCKSRAETYISKLLNRLPVGPSDNETTEEYKALLDRVLEDRIVDESEFFQMKNLSDEVGMTREQAVDVHRQYMRELILAALDDGIITASEERDLETVRNLLEIPLEEYISLLSESKEMFEKGVRYTGKPLGDFAGKSVCFTGSMNCLVDGQPATRSIAQRTAAQAGMVVKKGVTKDLELLVLADPESLSGKAKKARKYGTRLIAEPVFWRAVGIDVG